MLKKIKDLFVREIIGNQRRVSKTIASQKVLTGRMLSVINEGRTAAILEDIHKAEFKVFSQWGDDGIIQFLVNYIEDLPKFFVEFGVEDYEEANTRFLLINNNWSGLIMDGSQKAMNHVQNSDLYWRHELTAKCEFITKTNINSLLKDYVNQEIGLLHIDIDGMDYWVWKEITVTPPIVIVEYNSVFGLNPWSLPYQGDYTRQAGHYSNLYYGTSLTALCELAKHKGYAFIGCNSNGNNAYFIRKDKMKDLKPLTPEQGFVSSKFKESRKQNGELSFLSGIKRLEEIKGLPVINILNNTIETI